MFMPEKCVTVVCRDGAIVEEMVGMAMDTGCKYLVVLSNVNLPNNSCRVTSNEL